MTLRVPFVSLLMVVSRDHFSDVHGGNPPSVLTNVDTAL